MGLSSTLTISDFETIVKDTIYFADTSVEINTTTSESLTYIQVYCDTFTPPTSFRCADTNISGTAASYGFTIIIPKGHYYKVTSTAASPAIIQRKRIT